jgi:hypothetical protein
MTNTRLITTAACALGAAILAATVLQSTPAEARGKAGGHTASSAHLNTHKRFQIAKVRMGQVPGVKAIPPGNRPPFDPGHIQFDPGNNPGGSKTPPVITGNPTRTPIPPVTGGNLPSTGNPNRTPIPPVTTGPINPGDLPGSRPPVLTPNPTRTPIPPVTGPTNPGNYPGGSIPPILSGTPTPAPIPVPIPTGSSPSPNPGYGTGYARRYGQFRVYADIGVAGDAYAPCWWLRANYDRTGNVYWLNRYKVCLWQH